MGLEGIVSKRRNSSYRSGLSPDWIKSKNPACAAVSGQNALVCRNQLTGAGKPVLHAIELDNAVMAGFADMTFAIHLCRGNQEGRWLVEGDYEPIARPIFQRIGATRLLLEYDDNRSGSFAPLRHVPDDKMVVLGLVSTKRPQIEAPEDLIHRITQANRFVPLTSISPDATGCYRSTQGSR